MINLPFGSFSNDASVTVTFIPFPNLGTVGVKKVTGKIQEPRVAMGNTYIILNNSNGNGQVVLEINVKDIQSIVAA